MAHTNGNSTLAFASGNPRANEAARKLAEVQEDAFRKAVRGNPLLERSIAVSKGVTAFYPNGVEKPEDIREILAAQALGLIQSLSRSESERFLATSSALVFQAMQKDRIPDIFMGKKELNAEDAELRRMDVLSMVLSYTTETTQLFKIYRSICDSDVTEKDKSEYDEIYAQPIINDEIPRVVMLLRFVDLSESIEDKIAVLGESGSYYTDRELLELSKTMMDVYYPLSDGIGLGTTRAVMIRRHATNILEAVLKRKAKMGGADDRDIEKLRLYERCKIYYDMLEPSAEKLAAEFITSGELKGILGQISQKTKLKMELASHTSDNEHIYRVKGPSGIFWKVLKHREEGKKYEIADVKDFLSTTMVVDGGFEDARAVARRMELHLRHRFRTFDIEMDADERPTGYKVPHITCSIKVGGMEVPFEVQVRTAETHEESKTGDLAHAKKISAKISGFITRELIEKLKATFEEMQKASDTLRMLRSSLLLPEKSNRLKYKARVLQMDGKAQTAVSCRDVDAVKGECVGGIVALSVGPDKAVDVYNAADFYDLDRKRLDLFGHCPEEILIEVREGPGINRNTCDMLLNGSVLTPEAQEIISEYRKIAPRKKWYKR